MRPQSARGYRYLVVPKELIENLAFSSLDFGAVILYAKILKRAGLSAQHEDKFPDEHGRLFIIYTVEQMKRDLQSSHPTIVKLTKQLADIGLIEKVRQGKPSKTYMGDLFAAVSPAGRFMDPAYLFQKGAFLQLAGAWCSSAPCIIAAFGDLKPLRHLCDQVAVDCNFASRQPEIEDRIGQRKKV